MQATTRINDQPKQHSSDVARWQRARDNALQRGHLICELLEAHVPLRGAVALDAGCGFGATSIALCERGADVIAVDRNEHRLRDLITRCGNIETECADLASLPWPDASFDVVVLQDVIEHVSDADRVLGEIHRVLQSGGFMYLSTPNRDSLVNLLADPHFGLPLLARKSREEVRAVLRKRRPAEAGREDIAELLSFNDLQQLLTRHGFSMQFENRKIATALFESPENMLWSRLHLSAARFLRRSGLYRIALGMVSDHAGFFNTWLNPSWYLICRKTM
jgi:SAM-dependent methyltransferase